MDDLYSREQRILDAAAEYISSCQAEASCPMEEYQRLVNEYGKLLRQVRRFTRLSDQTATNLHMATKDLLDKVQYDKLTGIYNRGYLEEYMFQIMKEADQAGGFELCILMIDVDYFKRYNDTYGHNMGDECLKQIALSLNRSISREGDVVARYGGEEFVAVLPHTDKEYACEIAGRVLDDMHGCRIPHEKNSVSEFVTVSIGATCGILKNGSSADAYMEYIKQADKALYISKNEGRNRYTFLDME